jgi:hypothetical protein
VRVLVVRYKGCREERVCGSSMAGASGENHCY